MFQKLPTNDDNDFLSERLLITTLVAVMESRIVVDVERDNSISKEE
jgi:hypothetical protein